MDAYLDRGARALVLLHERELRRFLAVWRRAEEGGLAPPPTDDPDCASLDALLRHVLGCARGYLVWTCRTLELPDPGIRPAPPAEALAREADVYLEHVLERWRSPLARVPAGRLDRTHAPSAWGVDYCVDAMLEHAVMHPVRHAFQIEGWLEAG